MALPWQIRLENLFEDKVLSPPQMARRDEYFSIDDVGVHNKDQNMLMRMRSHEVEGHGYIQEMLIASGERVGQVLRGNDRSFEKATQLNYADVLLQVGDIMHIKTGTPHNLLWNFTPLNPRFNPTFQLPKAIKIAEDAFQFAKAAIPGVDKIEQVAKLIPGVKLKGPFDVYCAISPQKLMAMNDFYKKALDLMMAPAGAYQVIDPDPGVPPIPLPVTTTPLLAGIAKLARAELDTLFEPSTQGTLLGKTAKSFLLASVPGIGPALAFGG